MQHKQKVAMFLLQYEIYDNKTQVMMFVSTIMDFKVTMWMNCHYFNEALQCYYLFGHMTNMTDQEEFLCGMVRIMNNNHIMLDNFIFHQVYQYKTKYMNISAIHV